MSFLRDALDDLSRTVWSSLRATMSSDDTTTIRAVVSNGRYFDRTALDGLLAEVRRVKTEAGEGKAAGDCSGREQGRP